MRFSNQAAPRMRANGHSVPQSAQTSERAAPIDSGTSRRTLTTAPFPQAFFALRGWPTSVRVVERDVIIPAGRFGVYRFDLDEENLLGDSAPQ